jgi:hypothetical protein
MSEHDTPDTEAAPTAAAELAEPTTELPPATHAAAELAWSLPTDDDDTEPAEVEPRHSLLVWSALVALVAALAGALIFLGTTLFGAGSPKPVEPSSVPSPTTTVRVPVPAVTVTPPPPAPTVTVTAPPPVPPPAPAPAPAINDNCSPPYCFGFEPGYPKPPSVNVPPSRFRDGD